MGESGSRLFLPVNFLYKVWSYQRASSQLDNTSIQLAWHACSAKPCTKMRIWSPAWDATFLAWIEVASTVALLWQQAKHAVK